MTKPILYLLAFLLFLGCSGFVYGIYEACYFSCTGHPEQMSDFISGMVTSIAAVLSTNLGAVLGITVSNPASHFRKTSNWNPLTLFTNGNTTVLQTIACYVYILCLLTAALFWGHYHFADPKTLTLVPLIPEFTKSLVGVIVGVLAIALNIPANAGKPITG